MTPADSFAGQEPFRFPAAGKPAYNAYELGYAEPAVILLHELDGLEASLT